jgi:hypothetical protein
MGGLPDDSIQGLRPASVWPPVARICSEADRTHWPDVPTRWLAARIRPGCHRSSPSRSGRDGKNGRSMVRLTCLSMGSGPIRHLIGRFRNAPLHRAADPTDFATPKAGLGRPRFPVRYARPCHLGLRHRCFAARHRCLAGRRHAPSSLFRPAWALLPDPGNRQCHAGAENQTEFEGS